MCWEQSFIPKEVWQVGDATSNIIESLHSESNTEGISCTLVGGVQRGQHVDLLKEKTLTVSIVILWRCGNYLYCVFRYGSRLVSARRTLVAIYLKTQSEA